MYNFPIGVILETFKVDRSEAIKKASKLGIKGIQMYAASGKNAPENLSKADRIALKQEVIETGMVFSALCGDFGMGFHNKGKNPELIEKSKRIVELAKDLGTDIITTHIGVIPTDKEHERYKVMQEACFELSRFADSMEAHFAIETGPETSDTLKEFLDDLHSTGVAVNFDPANLKMVTGDDPVKAVYTLKDYIVHTHAKDGIRLNIGNPEFIYKTVSSIPQDFNNVKYFEVVLLGSGSVDFPGYLKALEEIGYRGFLTIECKAGDNPEKEIKDACVFLNETISADLKAL